MSGVERGWGARLADLGRVKERMSVGDWVPSWLRYQHLCRYAWAGAYCHGARVADAACGIGYGSRMLAGAGALSVDGYDASDDAIRQARSAGERGGVRFAVADAAHLPVAEGTYDVLVSFETIEHIEDDRGYLREAARVLKRGGTFLCSTPNRDVIDAGKTLEQRPFNPFHVREYDEHEFAALLGGHFASVALYGQTPYGGGYVGALGRVGRSRPWAAVRIHQARKLLSALWDNPDRHTPRPLPLAGRPEVLLAVCRND